MQVRRVDTEERCHCGAEYEDSDHCPECGCEQYESISVKDCGHEYAEVVSGEIVEEPDCPLCEGPGVYIGTLGSRPWHRCRNCGLTYSYDGEDLELSPEGHHHA